METFIRWQQMAAVLQILTRTFEENKYADKGIELEFKHNRKWGAKDRKIIAESTYDMLRWWRRLHFYLGWDWQEEKTEEDYWRLALVWMQWRGYQKPSWENVEDFDYSSLDKKIKAECEGADKYSLPNELYELGSRELGEDWHEYLDILNGQAPVFLRANTLKIKPEELQEALAAENIETELIENSDALKLVVRKNVFITDAFKKGYFEVQDLGSQSISNFLDVKPGNKVIDACAGAGGKSLHLASLMKNKGKIISLDIHEWKLKELRKRARRDGVDIVECRPIQDTKVIKRLSKKADKLLLDVPCSGLGVLKRNPDTKWKFDLERLEELLNIQKNILQSYSTMVKSGGELVYATCSVLPSENEKQVQIFLTNNTGWELVAEKKLKPIPSSNDGFYMAKLVNNTQNVTQEIQIK